MFINQFLFIMLVIINKNYWQLFIIECQFLLINKNYFQFFQRRRKYLLPNRVCISSAFLLTRLLTASKLCGSSVDVLSRKFPFSYMVSKTDVSSCISSRFIGTSFPFRLTTSIRPESDFLSFASMGLLNVLCHSSCSL